MIVFIARHAWAYEHGDPRWPDDSQRPLEDERRGRYEMVVANVVQAGFAPQAIATSPYLRCVQTSELIADGVRPRPRIVELAALQPASDFDELVAWTQAMEDEGANEVCWVGHAPDVGVLAGALIGASGSSIRFPKGSIAAIRMDEIVRGGGELLWHATAKLLGA